MKKVGLVVAAIASLSAIIGGVIVAKKVVSKENI